MNAWFDELKHLCQSAFSCGHGRARVVEGKTYCPDCGHGVVFRWTVLHCQGCGTRRPSQYRFRHVVPVSACCTACGQSACETRTLHNPEYFQLRHALLSFEPEASTAISWSGTCQAWIVRLKACDPSPMLRLTGHTMGMASS